MAESVTAIAIPLAPFKQWETLAPLCRFPSSLCLRWNRGHCPTVSFWV